MRRIIYGLLVFFLLSGCDESDDKKHDSQKITEIENTAIAGQWKITLFSEDGTDETANYSDYQFTFEKGAYSSTITAVKGVGTFPGVWSITDNNTGDDSDHFEDLDFFISFSAPPDLSELTEDWEILSMSDTEIELRHTSGGGGGTDLLTFTKV
jgi:hypothetical protein